jgi:hypothetical protein
MTVNNPKNRAVLEKYIPESDLLKPDPKETAIAAGKSADDINRQLDAHDSAAFDPIACEADAREIASLIRRFYDVHGRGDENSERSFLQGACINTRWQVEFNQRLSEGNLRVIERARAERRGFLAMDIGDDRDAGIAGEDEKIRRHSEFLPVNLQRRDCNSIMHQVLDPRHDEIAANSVSDNPPKRIALQWLDVKKRQAENKVRREQEALSSAAKLDAAYGKVEPKIAAHPLPKIA